MCHETLVIKSCNNSSFSSKKSCFYPTFIQGLLILNCGINKVKSKSEAEFSWRQFIKHNFMPSSKIYHTNITQPIISINYKCLVLNVLGGCGISMEGGLDRLGRIPGVELGPGVESPLGVGVLDLSPGVPALSRCHTQRNTLQKYTRKVQLLTHVFDPITNKTIC